MKKVKTIIMFIGVAMLLFSCNNKSEQKTAANEGITIGNQTWASANLDVSAFRNGDSIRNANTYEDWAKATQEQTPAWCYYDNEPANGKKYGKLYNWYAVNDPRGLAPAGWHIPNAGEWSALVNFLGGDSVAGDKIKAASAPNNPGLAAPLGGYSESTGGFMSSGSTGVYWSSSVGYDNSIWVRLLSLISGNVESPLGDKGMGAYIRCVKGDNAPELQSAGIELKKGLHLVYNVKQGDNEYQFITDITSADDKGVVFDWTMTEPVNNSGTITLTPKALNEGGFLHFYPTAKKYDGKDICMIFSKTLYDKLASFKKGDSWALGCDACVNEVTIDNVENVAYPAKDKAGAETQLNAFAFRDGSSFVVQNNPKFPLILYFNNTMTIELKSFSYK